MSVYLSVTPAVSGVHGADEQQKDNFGPTYSVRLQFTEQRRREITMKNKNQLDALRNDLCYFNH